MFKIYRKLNDFGNWSTRVLYCNSLWIAESKNDNDFCSFPFMPRFKGWGVNTRHNAGESRLKGIPLYLAKYTPSVGDIEKITSWKEVEA